MRKVFAVFFLILLFVVVFNFNSVQAAGLVPCGRTDPDATPEEREPCTLCHLFVMFDRWIDSLLFMFVPVLAALMIAIGGGMYIISQGKPEMLSKAKSLFTSIVIGLVIIYGAWLIINLFLTVIGATVWQGPGQGWWIINCP